MYLKKLRISNFRCHKAKNVEFSKGVNIILGKNAVGKTSLVEAISYLSVGKSHKTNKDEEVITLKTEYSLIFGTVFDGKTEKEIFVGITKDGKRIKRDDKPLKSISEHIGFFNEVVFSPEDIPLLTGSPAERRRFLDLSVSQIDKNYMNSLANYKKLLKQRNEILKNPEVEKYVENSLVKIITSELIKYAKDIVRKRKEFIDELSPFVKEAGNKISEGNEEFYLQYNPNTAEDELEKKFQDRLNFDVFQKTTTSGPHRDDFFIEENDKNVAIYGSQGQIRTAALSLKLGLSNYYKSKNVETVIVLDDVFSELDKSRQNNLIGLLENNTQVFITTTSIEELDEKVKKDSNIIYLRECE